MPQLGLGLGIQKGNNALLFSNTLLYILDSYSSGELGASYGLRRLNSNYSTYACRVRRSNDNAEQDIGFTNGDLDTTSLATFVGANSAYIAKWYDQSGNSNHAIQATDANQPRIVDAGVQEVDGSGKISIRFGLVSSYLNFIGMAITSKISVNAVVMPATSDGFPTVASRWASANKQFKLSASGGGNGIPYLDTSSNGNNDIYRNYANSIGTSIKILTSVYNGDDLTINNYLNENLSNGSLNGTIVPSLFQSVSAITIGRQTDGSNNFIGLISELNMFRASILASQVQALIADQKSYYSIT